MSEPAALDELAAVAQEKASELDALEQAARISRIVAETELFVEDLKKAKIEAEFTETRHARWLVDDAQRHYVFSGEVNSHTVRLAYEALETWHRRTPDCPMTIVISSPGGEVFAGDMLFGKMLALRASGHHITTVIHGAACSMAGILFQAGSERVINEYATLHVHEPQTWVAGSASEIKDESELLEQMRWKMSRIYSENAARVELSGRKVRKVRSGPDKLDPTSMTSVYNWVERHNRWLTAIEAFEYGFADRIE